MSPDNITAGTYNWNIDKHLVCHMVWLHKTSKWHALIEEDKDNQLQFAKVFQILKVTNSPKFFPATILHYTVSLFALFLTI